MARYRNEAIVKRINMDPRCSERPVGAVLGAGDNYNISHLGCHEPLQVLRNWQPTIVIFYRTEPRL